MSFAFPAHTCCARLLSDHNGDRMPDALTIQQGALVLVQGDRSASDGWVWCCTEGKSGLLPTACLKPAGSKAFPARVLFDFAAGDESELSCEAGERLQLLPSVSDPEGWCTAMQRRQQGLVPQAYMQPIDERREGVPSPAKPPASSEQPQ